MKKLVSLILCLAFLITSIFGLYTVSASEKNLYAVIDSTVDQYHMSHHGSSPENTDELISYANHLCSGDAIILWDDVYDGDGIMGNTFSSDRYFADGNDILFQSEEEADNPTNIFIHYNMVENSLEYINDKSELFDLLDSMDKNTYDEILEDGFGCTVTSNEFISNDKIKISLKKDKFSILGVGKPKKVKVDRVELDDESLEMTVGEEYELTATVYPLNATDQRLIWKSSKKSVISVDNNGVMTAKKAGKAKITAITVDGKKTAICNVTVSAE